VFPRVTTEFPELVQVLCFQEDDYVWNNFGFY
jgi:hypothetical protein